MDVRYNKERQSTLYFLSGIGVPGIEGEHALLRIRGAGLRHDGEVKFGIMNNLPLLR